MKSIFLTVTLLTAHFSAQAAPMVRFWRGYQLETLAHDQFLDGLNRKFIPWTASLGTERTGMVGYLPAVSRQHGGDRVPEEFALVVYSSEAKYREFRATPAGQAYSEGHWEYFDKTLSHSAVAEPFQRQVAAGKAYALTGYSGRWDVGYARFTLFRRANSGNDAEIVAWLSQQNVEGVDEEGRGHLGRIVLVEANFIAAYDLWSSREAYSARNDDSMDDPADFEDFYAGTYGVGTLTLDLELPNALRELADGEGLQAPLAP